MIANSVAVLINAGKVYITQNPLAISWPQGLAFLRYAMPEVAFLLYGRDAAKSKMVEDEIVNEYHSINEGINRLIGSYGDCGLIV